MNNSSTAGSWVIQLVNIAITFVSFAGLNAESHSWYLLVNGK